MLQRLISIILAGFLIDFIIYKGFRNLPSDSLRKKLRALHLSVILAFVITALGFLLITGLPDGNFEKFRTYMILFDIFGFLYFSKFVLAIFILIGQVITWLRESLIRRRNLAPSYLPEPKRIPLYFKAGGIAAILLFLGFLYGMFWGITDFKVRKVDLYFEDLPASFEGFKIIQFSDAHLGSWRKPESVRKALRMINEENPDLIAFTGDLINLDPKEVDPYLPDFEAMKAKYGKYAILGNHDIGDYTHFGSEDNTQRNIMELTKFYLACNFQLLRNQHVTIKKNQDSIALLGVDNWSLKKFRRLGRLDLALKGTEAFPFKILLTHDPSHWDAEVNGKTSIDLSLSGHTHGMQMGIRLPGFRWSPFGYVYSEWIGLYKSDNQFIYVNAGLGFVGFAARIGIAPEITRIILHRK